MPGFVLWLLRHGEAAHPLGVDDAERPLTDEGRRQASSAGDALAGLAPQLAAVLTSPRRRALDTAQLAVAAHGTAPAPMVFDELGGDYSAADLLALLTPWRDAAGRRDVLVVGHNPVLASLVHQFTGDGRGLSTGTLVGIDLPASRVLHYVRPR